MKRIYAVAIILLSMAVGAMGVLVVQKAGFDKRLLKTEYSDWRKLNLILQTIDNNYVDTVDRKAVTDAAVAAALARLDPHSVYMPPVELEESEEDLAGNFDGIGIQFNVPNDTAVVLEVVPGGPSEKIGILPGDRIVKVGDKVIAGVEFPQDSMVRRMRGPAGTKVSVTVRRDGETIPFEITRDKIPTYSVDASFMVNDSTGYLRLSKFSKSTFVEVFNAVSALKDSGMRKLIFDIRGNNGGFLDQALLVSNMFLPAGAEIVHMQGLHRKREDFKADGKGILQDVTLDVLIDESSASSSEIFAGAIQDNSRGRIIGRRSFGKGLVQEPVYFTDGSGIRLTVSRFYTPSGRCLQKPYTDDYNYEVYERYGTGEMVAADSMKAEKGGIIPDVFVPVDTTRASEFYKACYRKATSMRFASAYFDSHKKELQAVSDYDSLLSYLDNAGLEREFLTFASRKDGLRPGAGEWPDEYIMTQVRALVSRYSKLGDNAYYHIFLTVDKEFAAALEC